MEFRRKSLLVAGIGSCGMAAVHFFLPQAYGWKQYLELVPASVVRNMLAVNFLFSFLLLWGGCMTVLAALRHKHISAMIYLILYGMAAFWPVYVLYQFRVPPPIPDEVRKALLVVAFIIGILYMVFVFSRPRPARPEEKS